MAPISSIVYIVAISMALLDSITVNLLGTLAIKGDVFRATRAVTARVDMHSTGRMGLYRVGSLIHRLIYDGTSGGQMARFIAGL